MWIQSLSDLQEVASQKHISKELYLYVKDVIEKTNEILKPTQLWVVIEENVNNRKGYIVKWSREMKIGKQVYMEELLIKGKKGILTINKLE